MAETQQKCSKQCNRFKLQRKNKRGQERQVGKTDGINMRQPEATEASQATAVPEEYGPDAERQEVTSNELGTDQQQTQRSRV